MQPLQTVHPRAALGRVGRKLASGQQAVVAWLGGSITAGHAASDPERTSYRALVTNWFRGVFRAELVWEVNAAVGGTGSELGAFRLRRDVLAKDADVVFVEFAVNDDGATDESIVAAMEGIVRACRQRPAAPELCFVYTLSRPWVDALVAGELPRTMRLHERVAEHYGVPSVNVALDLAGAVASGEVAWSTAMKDDVHPLDPGFDRYAQTLRTALTDLLCTEPPPPAAPLPPPLSPHPLAHADMTGVAALPDAFPGLSLRPMTHRGGWDCFDAVLESATPGATAAFAFTGPTVGVLYELGPDTGDFAYQVDAGAWQAARPFDVCGPRVVKTPGPVGKPCWRLTVSDYTTSFRSSGLPDSPELERQYECPVGLHREHDESVLWVRSPRTGQTIALRKPFWRDLPRRLVSRIVQAVAMGRHAARFTTGELRALADLFRKYNAPRPAGHPCRWGRPSFSRSRSSLVRR